MPLFRKRPESFRAQQNLGKPYIVHSPEGPVICYTGDWHVTAQGLDGAQWSIHDPSFRVTYEPVDGAAQNALYATIGKDLSAKLVSF